MGCLGSKESKRANSGAAVGSKKDAAEAAPAETGGGPVDLSGVSGDVSGVSGGDGAVMQEILEEWEARMAQLEKEYPARPRHVLLAALQKTGGHTDKTKQLINAMPTEQAAPAEAGGGPVDLSGDGGVLKEILEEGSGAQALKNETAFVHYTGRLLDGTVFDSTKDKPYRREHGFYFTLGGGEVIKGWDVGVASMKVGEKAKFTCRSEYAYGSAGAGANIPPNATLCFEIDLLDSKKLNHAQRAEIDKKVEALRNL